MSSSSRSLISEHPVSSFFILTFLIAWLIWIPCGFFAPDLLPVLTLPGAWAPTLSAVILTGILSGRAGIRQLLGRLFRWRAGLLWYLVTLFGIAAIAFSAVALNSLLGGTAPTLSLPPGAPPEAWYLVIPIVFVVNLFFGGPLAEEFGWRGYALPGLQTKWGALSASLFIGVIWGIWHLPFFLFPNAGTIVGNIPFIWFVSLTIPWSVLSAWLYNNTQGSMLFPVLFHAATNTTLGTLGILQIANGDLRPLLFNVALTWVAVIIVVVVFGSARLSRKPQGTQ